MSVTTWERGSSFHYKCNFEFNFFNIGHSQLIFIKLAVLSTIPTFGFPSSHLTLSGKDGHKPISKQ